MIKGSALLMKLNFGKNPGRRRREKIRGIRF
jgi:hypothetical protein